jgi:hypothetical protein
MTDQTLPAAIVISRSPGGHSNTSLKTWITHFDDLASQLSAPVIGLKDGSYFVRSDGTKRSNSGTSREAHLLILDGDSRIDENGEIKPGAPDPEAVHRVLVNLEEPHLIYSSYSNGASREELQAKKIDSGGTYEGDYHKYRAILPCCYTPEQLPALLEYLFFELHQAGVMLAPVKENRVWSQPWYFPRVPDKKRLALFRFFKYDGGAHGC